MAGKDTSEVILLGGRVEHEADIWMTSLDSNISSSTLSPILDRVGLLLLVVLLLEVLAEVLAEVLVEVLAEVLVEVLAEVLLK